MYIYCSIILDFVTSALFSNLLNNRFSRINISASLPILFYFFKVCYLCPYFPPQFTDLTLLSLTVRHQNEASIELKGAYRNHQADGVRESCAKDKRHA